MFRRHGMEGIYGIAGGNLVSEESERNLNLARDMATKRKMNEALRYLKEALKDPHNLDASIELATFARTPMEGVTTLEVAAERGRKILLEEWLGPTAFDDDGEFVGNYWGLLETRPYMRVLNSLSTVYFETKQYAKRTKVNIEMLRLCPLDNIGIRKVLGSGLIRDGRYADALSFAQTWLTESAMDGTPPPRGGTMFQAPSKQPLSAQDEARMSERGSSGEITHTAALAAFKLWGDCPIARQYLRIASKVNPFILVRVLGKVRRPSEPNRIPRTVNGPEDAHDYLWLIQDHWMIPAVWNWVNNNPDAKKVLLKTCSRTGCAQREGAVAQFKRCAACKLEMYCSADCQKVHWREHKPVCKEHQARKATNKAFARGGQ
ncbi:hypothetical protein D9611_000712 [Ephemerocybe angulata]|uniref:Uncharacterized protein n=2 Tax=Ephemerocybe angulata TaxID=980116 RepID=A0A8H6HNR5_9AGAR|nr:hypothetical protein D9611_000712 [Tulosesus angulatus]KAF6749861.1 hypothetical protein DFP72DRAFT_911921 [Tulosesus angulatus]